MAAGRRIGGRAEEPGLFSDLVAVSAYALRERRARGRGLALLKTQDFVEPGSSAENS